ncbi:RNA-binding domain-containing protein [Planococcus halotolerans]|uniref:ATP-dependent DNA helicase RecG n=1 Tax=Planococcus halotolerans TaxID=2233542 RepID=A0A365KKT0_9BACL|nr:RNA-binding domain-containing protein [Planococcus halotolerans]RAZ73641.1 ATP-dependent DNA helicase RecG [Planococcus halotolerans]
MVYQPESVNIEYKKSTNSLSKEFWLTYSAFANTLGGQIILGVEETKDKQFIASGVNDPDKIIKTLFDTLQSNKVSINLITENDVKIETLKDNIKIIIVTVPEAPYAIKPVYLNGELTHSYIRRGEGDYKCTTQELAELIRNTRDILDDEIIEGFTIDDIDPETLKDYRIRISNLDTQEFHALQSDTEFLISIGAMRKNRSTGKEELTFGGLLFFGKYISIKEELPHFHLEFLNYIDADEKRWSDRIATGDMKYPNLNLYKFFIETLQKLKGTVKDSFELDEDLSRKSDVDIEVALREALANSIIHADYRHQSPIKISAFKDYYEFENPGKMRVSIEEFAMGGKSLPRNHVIELLFRKIGFCERAGSGGQKIFQTAIKRNYKTPDIELSPSLTLLRFWNVGLIESFNGYDEDTKEILAIMKKGFTSTSRAIEEQTNLKKNRIINILNMLIEDGVIFKQGQGRATIYIIKETPTESIAKLDHLVRQIQKSISNK